MQIRHGSGTVLALVMESDWVFTYSDHFLPHIKVQTAVFWLQLADVHSQTFSESLRSAPKLLCV